MFCTFSWTWYFGLKYKTHRFRCLRVIWCVASRWSRWTWLWCRYSCGRCVAVYILCKNTITPEIGMEPKKDPIEKETFAHSHCMKDSIIIARFLCHDHTASTVCYGYDAHLFWHLRTSPVASGIFRTVPAGLAPFPAWERHDKNCSTGIMNSYHVLKFLKVRKRLSMMPSQSFSRWCFFWTKHICSPRSLTKMIQFDLRIFFSMGWFNHQLL